MMNRRQFGVLVNSNSWKDSSKQSAQCLILKEADLSPRRVPVSDVAYDANIFLISFITKFVSYHRSSIEYLFYSYFDIIVHLPIGLFNRVDQFVKESIQGAIKLRLSSSSKRFFNESAEQAHNFSLCLMILF